MPGSGGSKSSGVPSATGKLWEGEGTEEGAASMATPMTPMVSQAGKSITPITPASEKDIAQAATITPPSQPQPSAGFRAAQAAGVFRGHGWKDSAAADGSTTATQEHPLSFSTLQPNGFKSNQAAAKARTAPGMAAQRPAGKGGKQAGQTAAAGKGAAQQQQGKGVVRIPAWTTVQAQAKKQRTA